jgi:hypothetical protein
MVGILFFHFFSEVTVNLNLVEQKNLNRNTIINLLNISAFIKNLDVKIAVFNFFDRLDHKKMINN